MNTLAFSLGICLFRRLSLYTSKITLLSSSFYSLYSLQSLAIHLTNMISDAIGLNNSVKMHPNQQRRSFSSKFCPQHIDRFPVIFSPMIIFKFCISVPLSRDWSNLFSFLNGNKKARLFDLYPLKDFFIYYLLSLWYWLFDGIFRKLPDVPLMRDQASNFRFLKRQWKTHRISIVIIWNRWVVLSGKRDFFSF